MIQFFRKRMNKKGFTLVELLIVIAVLGIIAAIAVPRMAGVTDAVKVSADERQAQLIFSDVEAKVLAGVIKVADGANADLTSGAAGTYKEVIPSSQVTSKQMTINVARSGSTYTVVIKNGTDDANLLTTGNTFEGIK